MDADPKQLEKLARLGRLDELLSLVSLEESVDAWWRYQVRERSEGDELADHPDWWAVELWLEGAIYERDDLAEQGLRMLAERAPEGADLGYLGAGPIETFLEDEEEQLRWIEREAARSPNFRTALGTVWAWGFMSDASFLRLERAAGVRLAWDNSGDHGPRPEADVGGPDLDG